MTKGLFGASLVALLIAGSTGCCNWPCHTWQGANWGGNCMGGCGCGSCSYCGATDSGGDSGCASCDSCQQPSCNFGLSALWRLGSCGSGHTYHRGSCGCDSGSCEAGGYETGGCASCGCSSCGYGSGCGCDSGCGCNHGCFLQNWWNCCFGWLGSPCGCQGCGETYWNDWQSHPPCTDPCDCCGGWAGSHDPTPCYQAGPRYGSVPLQHGNGETADGEAYVGKKPTNAKVTTAKAQTQKTATQNTRFQ